MFFFYCILYYITSLKRNSKSIELGDHAIHQVTARLGQNARFRRLAPQPSERHRARSRSVPRRRWERRGRQAEPSARPEIFPLGRRIRTEVGQVSKQARLGKCRCSSSPLSPWRQAGPVGSLLRGLPGPPRKVLGDGGTTWAASAQGRRRGGPVAPRHKDCANRTCNNLGNSEPLWGLCHPSCPAVPRRARSLSPESASVHPCLFSAFSLRVVCARPRRGRAGRRAQPFPPRPGPPFPPVSAD